MDSNGKESPQGKARGIPSVETTPSRQPGEADGGTSRENRMTDESGAVRSVEKKSTLSPLAPVFVPKHFKVQLKEDNHSAVNEPYSYPMVELLGFINDVTLSPAEFDAKIVYLTNALECVSDVKGLTAVVDTIFDKGVNEPNFRYSGARLCNHLGNNLHIKNLEEDTFTNLLLDRCHVECLRRSDLAAGDFGGPYLRGLLLFIAELFSQMVFSREDSSYKVKHVAACIPDMMHTLLQAMSKDNIKCTIQVLKLTGGNLEDLEKAGAPGGETPNMDSLFSKLSELAQRSDIDATSERMIKNVLDLREKNWGRTSTPSDSPASSAAEDSLPILCGPDGIPLSREEEVFLERQFANFHCNDGDYSNNFDNEEMDDEIAAAYEEFLLQSGQ